VMHDAAHGTHYLAEYSTAVMNGGDPVDSFATTVGPPSAIEHKLSVYVRHVSFRALAVSLADHLSSKQYPVRSLSPAEADAVRGDFLVATGHDSEASKLIHKALQADPKLGLADALMSSVRLHRGDRAGAADWARKAIRLAPQDHHGYLADALACEGGLMSPNAAVDVEQDLTRVTELRPGLTMGEVLLSQLELDRKEKPEEALRLAADAAQNAPEDSYTLENFEMILLSQNRQADAVRIELRMLHETHTPAEEASVRNNLGWLLLRHHVALSRAEFEIRRASRLEPKSADIEDSLAYVLKEEGNLTAAQAEFKLALAANPKLVSSLEGLGDVLRAQHDWDGAVSQYRAALAVDPGDARAHYGLALALQRKDDSEQAQQELQAARKLDPFNAEYQRQTANNPASAGESKTRFP
jgi:tetratricopeptide (TPR) repeat protein